MDDDTYNYSVHDSWGQAKPTKNYLAGPTLYMSCLDTYIYIHTYWWHIWICPKKWHAPMMGMNVRPKIKQTPWNEVAVVVHVAWIAKHGDIASLTSLGQIAVFKYVCVRLFLYQNHSKLCWSPFKSISVQLTIVRDFSLLFLVKVTSFPAVFAVGAMVPRVEGRVLWMLKPLALSQDRHEIPNGFEPVELLMRVIHLVLPRTLKIQGRQFRLEIRTSELQWLFWR